MEHLATREREVTVALIAHLAELEARRLYLAGGYSSLFVYCTQVLQLSEHAAYGRITAARAARRFPVILEMLAGGSVNLTTVVLLAAHLTPDNHRDLLDTARDKTRRQVVAPQDTRRDSESARDAHGDASVEGLTLAPAPPPARPAVVAPLAPERYRIQFTVNAQTHAKLQRAQDLLGHQIPDGDVGQIIDRALTALLEDLARKKLAATDRPRTSRGTERGSRHIPAAVKREVWVRDDNIQLRCRAHNGHEAERYFGRRPAAVKEPRAHYSVQTEYGLGPRRTLGLWRGDTTTLCAIWGRCDHRGARG